MDSQRRVLILTANVGFGHKKAATALEAALKTTYGDRCVVEVVNPLDDSRTPAVLRDSQADYDQLVREMPDFYKLRYQISDGTVTTAIVESAITVMLFNVIKDIIASVHPDVILATHPMYPAPVSAVNSIHEKNIPFFTIVTDLAMVHRLWFNPAAELCLVPTGGARQEAIEAGIPKRKVLVTGIPVHPDLVVEPRDAAQIRAELGWEPELRTILVVGSKRVRNLVEVLHVLNHSGLPMQLAVVAGGDDRLYSKLQSMEWHSTVHLYNYVDNLSTLMRASDCIISKAGGLIVTESLACGLPMLLVDITPGQEEGNAAYVLENGAAERSETPLEALEILFHWLHRDGELLKERARRARQLGRPRAAFQIAELAWNAAERGPLPFPESRLTLMPKLIEMLSQFGLVGKGTAAGDTPRMV